MDGEQRGSAERGSSEREPAERGSAERGSGRRVRALRRQAVALEGLEVLEREEARLFSARAGLLVELDRAAVCQEPVGSEGPAGSGRAGGRGAELGAADADVVLEVAGACRLGQGSAGLRLLTAVHLVERLPVTLAALAAGEVFVPQARVVLEETAQCDERACEVVERLVWPAGRMQCPGELRRRVKRAVLRAGVAAAEVRHRQARADRRVSGSALPDGMGLLTALLPAEELRRFLAGLDDLARAGRAVPDRCTGRLRTADQLRADTLAALPGWVLHPAQAVPVRPDPTRPAGTPSGTPSGNAAGTPALDGVGIRALDRAFGRAGTQDSSRRAPDGHHDMPGPLSPAPPDPAGPAGREVIAAAGPAPAGPGPADPARGGCGCRTQVFVHVPVSTALGACSEPAELVGYGPVGPAQTGRLLDGADLRRVDVDARTGEVLAVADRAVPTVQGDPAGQRTALIALATAPRAGPDPASWQEPGHDPSNALHRLVLARYRHCDGPGCAVPATRCDLDHEMPWPAGPTSPANLRPRSRRCHRAKTFTWQVRTHPDGSSTWTSPTGRRYTRSSPWQPPPPLPDLTCLPDLPHQPGQPHQPDQPATCQPGTEPAAWRPLIIDGIHTHPDPTGQPPATHPDDTPCPF